MIQESAHIAPEIKRGSAGASLRTAREKYGLTLEDVAAELRLSAYQIRALEEDRYDDLPGETYVRGYLRAYSRLVDVDENLVLPHASGWKEQAAVITGIHPVVRETRSSDRHMRFLSIIIVAVLLGLMYTWWQSREEPLLESLVSLESSVTDKPDSTTATAKDESKDSLTSLNTDDADALSDTRDLTTTDHAVQALTKIEENSVDSTTEMTANVEPETVVVEEKKVEKKAESKVLESETKKDKAPKQQAKVEDVSTANLADGQHVVLTFSGTSWVDIRDARGERLLYQSMTEGRSITVKGIPPFKVFLGNADVVKMSYRGRPFDFSGFRSGIYARFQLGKGN